jgi:hypothetical protein
MVERSFELREETESSPERRPSSGWGLIACADIQVKGWLLEPGGLASKRKASKELHGIPAERGDG